MDLISLTFASNHHVGIGGRVVPNSSEGAIGFVDCYLNGLDLLALGIKVFDAGQDGRVHARACAELWCMAPPTMEALHLPLLRGVENPDDDNRPWYLWNLCNFDSGPCRCMLLRRSMADALRVAH